MSPTCKQRVLCHREGLLHANLRRNIMEGIVEPTENDQMDQMIEQVAPEVETNDQQAIQHEEVREKTMIPLSVAQKLREQKRELELELQWERQKNNASVRKEPEEEDNSRYESATREDLSKSQEEAIRVIEERMWIKQNPEKYEKINEHLPKFLKQRPNLAGAINQSSNRYEEAYTLMEALTPKQQQQLKSPQIAKRETPNAPGGVPKGAALNQAVDVMNMSDKEFAEWRSAQKRNR